MLSLGILTLFTKLWKNSVKNRGFLKAVYLKSMMSYVINGKERGKEDSFKVTNTDLLFYIKLV